MSMDVPEVVANEMAENVGAPEGIGIEKAVEKVEPVEEVKNGGEEKRWPGWPGENVFRILVPAHKVGGIIGRKGEFIKKMCEESKARIKILDGPHTMAHSAPERAVMVSAKEEPGTSISPAMDGLLRVHKRVIEGSPGETVNVQPNLGTGNAVKTRLLAPASQARSLIGKQGSTIKSIQEASNTVVRILEEVPAFALQEDMVIEIQGESIGVHKAVELISGRLRKFLVDKGVLPLFESSISMPNAPPKHMVPPPQPWGHPQGPPPNPGSSYGGSPFMAPPPRPHESFYPPPDVPPMEKSQYGREPPPPMGVHSANQPPPAISQVTHHMQIPLSYADAVIGTSGASISYIRRASGATITIQETRGVPGEMTVEINGSASQVQTAQQLIHNFMAEASVPTSGAPPPADQAYNYQGHGSSNSYMSGQPSSGPGHPSSGGYGSGYGTNYGY